MGMSEAQDWRSFKESVMSSAFRVSARSRVDNRVFEREILSSEMGVSSEDSRQRRRFALAVGELIDEGRLVVEDRHAFTLGIAQ